MSDTEKIKAALQREIEQLERARDELRVKIHLAAADTRDELDKLETQWNRIRNELSLIGAHSKEPIDEIGHAARELASELRKGYERIRRQLTTH
jgi:predicted  nucleic acid-binding Zn-ribbon protein